MAIGDLTVADDPGNSYMTSAGLNLVRVLQLCKDFRYISVSLLKSWGCMGLNTDLTSFAALGALFLLDIDTFKN